MAKVHGLLYQVKIQEKFQAPGFRSTQFQPLRPFGKWIIRWMIPSLCFCFCKSTLEIWKKILLKRKEIKTFPQDKWKEKCRQRNLARQSSMEFKHLAYQVKYGLRCLCYRSECLGSISNSSFLLKKTVGGNVDAQLIRDLPFLQETWIVIQTSGFCLA